MLILQGVTYIHPNKDLLFEDLNLVVNRHEKIALIGNNGTGKSTLLKIMAGLSMAADGTIKNDTTPWYLPQVFGQFDHLSVSDALGVSQKLQSLHSILAGDASEQNLLVLNDDWDIEERCKAAMHQWHLVRINPATRMSELSGGEKTKVFLAGITIHNPALVLLDEPSNHLDSVARELLYEFIRTTKQTIVVVSHDRTLLNITSRVIELSKKGLKTYGGNYDFYLDQKQLEAEALARSVNAREKDMRKAKEIERETAERRQKLDSRGKKKQEKAGLPTISMNTLKNNAQKSTSRIKDVHAEKVDIISNELNELRTRLPEIDKMKIGFPDAALHKGKILVSARNLVIGYRQKPVNGEPLSFEIRSGQRINIHGSNGSGKTTLIRTILGETPQLAGEIIRAPIKTIYLDQDYSLIRDKLTVFEQALRFNTGLLMEHEVNIRLNRFLFTKEYWHKQCSTLSGGEKMRLILCCLTISQDAPDMIVLDEPTNNLDIQNVQLLTAAVNSYKGTLLVISHDKVFLREINIGESILLDSVRKNDLV